MPSFRFSGKRVLLTYSQVSEYFTRETVLYTLQERYPSLLKYSIGEETHEDGGRHIHAVLQFDRKIDSRDVTLFDISDGWMDFHPNIKPIQKGQANFDRCVDYTVKQDPAPLTNIETKLTWAEMLEEATDAADYMRLVRKHYPRDFALNYTRLEAMTKKVYPTSAPNTIENFCASFSITFPLELLCATMPPLLSTVVVGRPGCGKTTWAKTVAPKPALFVRHLDSLLELRDHHKSIIFDDLDFRHLPVSTQKYLVDRQDLCEIHVRYKVARIVPDLVRIFTANEYPFINDDSVHAQAINRRVNKIFIV